MKKRGWMNLEAVKPTREEINVHVHENMKWHVENGDEMKGWDVMMIDERRDNQTKHVKIGQI